ncbi:MAG: hypothetical protein PQJ60_12585, partial [Spirochaetales bacterium]|nr:hypothetical protein [Spirochaetales bacterium]
MEQQNLIARRRSSEDERKVIISLTRKGAALKDKARDVPKSLSEKILTGPFDREELKRMRESLDKLIVFLADHSE